MLKILVTIQLFLSIKICYTCNGVDFKVIYIKNCEDVKRPVIEHLNMTVILSEKCELVVDGCTAISRFSFAIYEVMLIRGTVTIHGSRAHICNEKYSNDIKKAGLAMIGLANQCTVEKNTMNCFKNQSIAFLPKNIRRVLPTFASKQSTLLLTATFEHDTGKSCLEAEFVLENKL